jgi:NAD(P)H-hydrate repair Nnr-like enzyme with NAD(P)H-hydrate epimerase domain
VNQIPFTTKKSEPVCTLTLSEKQLAFDRLFEQFGISHLQIAETAGFSAAMVSRFALGNYAAEGQVLGIVSDCLPGLVVLNCLRHIYNGGSRVHLLVLDQENSSECAQLLKPLQALGIPIDHIPAEDLAKPEFHSYFAELVECHHCCMCGTYEWPNRSWSTQLVQLLNEHSLPTHCIEYPLGVHPDTGNRVGEAQYANSTLALGRPLMGMAHAADYVGRTYVADISLPRSLIADVSKKPSFGEMPPLFSEQPVVQLILNKEVS